MSVLSIIANILLIRPLVWRLRDAGIGKNWAYFAVLPYLDFLMFVGLIFMPPSKTGIEPRATALSQME